MLLKIFHFPKFWKCLILFSTFWLTSMKILGENMFMEAWKQLLSSFPPWRSSTLGFRVKRFWIESSLTSGAELSSARTNLLYPVQGMGGGQLCCWGMHVKRHWRPVNSRLLIRCHIMDHLGHKEPGGKYWCTYCDLLPSQRCVEQIWASRQCSFSPANVFLIWTACSARMHSYQCEEAICWWLIAGDDSEIHLMLLSLEIETAT